MLREDLQLKSLNPPLCYQTKRGGSCYSGCLVPACQTLHRKKKRSETPLYVFIRQDRQKLFFLLTFTCYTWAYIPGNFPKEKAELLSLSRIPNVDPQSWIYDHDLFSCSQFAREAFGELALLMKTEIRGDHSRQSGSVGADCWQDDLGYNERGPDTARLKVNEE